MNYDDDYYKNCILCAVKTVVSLGFENIFSGFRILVDSSIPTSQKLGTSLAMITGIVLSLIVDTREMTDNHIWIPLQPHRLAKRLISKFSKIKQPGTYNNDDLEIQLASYFYGKDNSILFRKPADDDQSEMEEDELFCTKEILSEPVLLYMEAVPGSSKMKENIIKVKSLIEYRVFLKSMGLTDVAKDIKISEVLRLLQTSSSELRYQLGQKFDNKTYTKASVEETMGISFIELVQDVPYATHVIESIFAINPYE